ncbi:MAG TPA: NUDIX hydrolase, partial [Sphingomicrobium sp.]
MSRIVEWEGKYIRIVRQGRGEFVERCGGIHAVVILAEHDGKVVLIEQPRVPLGNRKCIELPAGLVG